MGLGLGIGIMNRRASSSFASELATTHIARVEADSGVVESEAVLTQVLNQLISTYSLSSEEDLNTKLPLLIDPAVFGYKVGTGSLATLGKAAEKLYSINSSADLEQTTAASQPALLRHNDIDGNYVYFPRERGTGEALRTLNNFTFTSATDTIVLTAKIHLPLMSTSGYDTLIYHLGFGLSYRNRGANVQLLCVGTTTVESSEYTPSTTDPHWLRMTVTPTALSFEWSANGTSWTSIDTGLTPPSFSGTNSPAYVGYTGSRTQNAANVYYAKVDNQTTGSYVVLDMNDYDVDTSDTQITSSYADATVWLIDRLSDRIELPMTLVDRSKVVGDGLARKISGTLTLSQPYTYYFLGRFNYSGTILGFAASSSLAHDGTNIDLNNGSELSIANALPNRNLLTIEGNGTSSKIRVNDGSDTEGDAGTNDGTYVDLFANGATYGTGQLEMLIISDASDSDAIKTAMFNYFG